MTGVKPDFNVATGTLTIPDLEGVEYRINGHVVEGEVQLDKTTVVTRSAKRGYKLAKGAEKVFKFEVSKRQLETDDVNVDVEVVTEDDPKPAEAIEGLSAGSTPQSPGQDSGRGFNRGSVNR